MKIINQSFEIMDDINGEEILKKLEKCGRVCYKSEDLTTSHSAERFIQTIIDKGHESVLEHVSITVKVITSRGISHQIVRHRIASYSQESQRFCNYDKDKFESEITFIEPSCFTGKGYSDMVWWRSCSDSEESYFKILTDGYTPEQAREVLPNSTKTELVMTLNIRSWRNFFKQRTDKTAHPEMRNLVIPMLLEFKRLVPIVFNDIEVAI